MSEKSANDSPMEPSETHVGRDSTRDEVDQSGYWDDIYIDYNREGDTPGWDLGEPNPEFVWRLQHSTPPIEPGKVIVLGCGFGYEAALFCEKGFEVTAVDFSDWAVSGARKNFEKGDFAIELLHADIFALPEKFDGQFDYVVEHTCYCAIHPSRRPEFRDVAHRLLKPGGQLIGLFYYHQKEGGPPYNTTPEEVREIWGEKFEIRTLAMAEHNIEKRRDKELWGRFYKK